MDPFICTACGTQYTPSSVAPRQCAICEEERQYVPLRGQTWTTLGALAAGHFNSYRQYELGVIGIGTQPSFAIGQRALLVCTPSGNVLWDCIAMLDPATITLINGLGGLKAIGISHPHFYTTMVEWSRAFGGVPIHLHADDHRWIMRPDPSIQLWNEETLELLPDVTLIRRTPQDIVRKIHSDTVAALAEPAVREKLEQGGIVVIGSTPDELASFLNSEMDRWGRIIKAANIRAQ